MSRLSRMTDKFDPPKREGTTTNVWFDGTRWVLRTPRPVRHLFRSPTSVSAWCGAVGRPITDRVPFNGDTDSVCLDCLVGVKEVP